MKSECDPQLEDYLHFSSARSFWTLCKKVFLWVCSSEGINISVDVDGIEGIDDGVRVRMMIMNLALKNDLMMMICVYGFRCLVVDDERSARRLLLLLEIRVDDDEE